MRQLLLCCGVALLTLALAGPGLPLVFVNSSAKSIPLAIPGVMNPRLVPFSTSNLELTVGQEIFFFHQGQSYLLLRVAPGLEQDKIDVPDLIRSRKKALGLKD